MKKLSLKLLVLVILLFPLFVFADNSKVEIKSIKLLDKSKNTEIIEDAKIENNEIKFNIKLYDINDYAKYEVVVKNNSNNVLEFDETSFGKEEEYIGYEFDYPDNSNRINPNKEKTFTIKVFYKNEVSKLLFRSSIYDASNSISIGLLDKSINIPDTLKNIGIIGIITIIVILVNIIIGLVILFKTKKINNAYLIVLLALLIIFPKNAKAKEIYIIPIDSNIILENVKLNPCKLLSDISQGTEYRLDDNPQYVYRYKQEYNGTEWVNIDTDGWGVALIDKDSTDEVNEKLCSSIKGKPIVSMSNMFKDSKSSKIDLSSFVTKNVTNMSGMFDGVASVESLDLSTFNTEKVTDMTSMFKDCSNLTSLFLRHFVTSSVEKIDTMFSGDTELTSINMDIWDVSNITSSTNTLGNTTALKTISAKEWKIPDSFSNWLTTRWGGSSSPIETVDVTDWDFTNITNISQLFNGKNTLKEIYGLNTWDVSNIENLNNLFSNCYGLKKIDLSSFDLSNTTMTANLIYGIPYLEELITPKEYGSNTISIISKLFDKALNYYSSLDDTSPKATKIESITLFDDGSRPVNIMASLAGSKNNIINVIRETDASKVPTSGTQRLSPFYSKKPILAWFNSGNIYYYSEDEKIYFNPNSQCAFCEMKNLNSIDLSNVDASAIVDMSFMFEGLTKLPSIDVSNWNTPHLVNMYGAFENMETIKTLDLSSFNTSNVTNMSYLVGNDYSLYEIDISSFDTSKVTDMSSMFYCTRIINLDLSHFDTSNVTTMQSMFSYASDLRRVDLSSFDTSKVYNFSFMFSSAHMLHDLDLSNFDFSKASNVYYMFNKNYGLVDFKSPINRSMDIELHRTLYDSNGNSFDTISLGNDSVSLVAKTEALFKSGHDFNTLINDLTNSTGPIEHIKRAETLPNHPIHLNYNSDYNMVSLETSQYPIYAWYESDEKSIYYYSELEKIYMNSYANDMFSYLTDLKTVDLTGIDTSKAVQMDYLFKNDTSLLELDLSGFDVRNVTTFYGAFKYLSSLERLDLSSFETNSATYMAEMIGGCTNLQYLDISNFVVDNVYNFDRFLMDTNSITELRAPKSYGSRSIGLPGSFYQQGDPQSISTLSSSVPPSAVLKRNPW